MLEEVWPCKVTGLDLDRMASENTIENIDELKEKISKCVHNSDMKYSGSWDAAPAILDWIKIDDIGTLN